VVAFYSVERRLEDFRRPDAPPMPGEKWRRFAHLTNLANLRPGAERWVTWYRALWLAPGALFAVVFVAFLWLWA
jgi:hypothetical protein